ncbi:15989_t:CDS:2 [Entrophospora sp. SA101]|nr:15989_t:CDS:2 [Entrophospora sp. SA101]
MKLKIEKLKKENGQLQTELYQQQEIFKNENETLKTELGQYQQFQIPQSIKQKSKNRKKKKESIKMKVQQEEEELFDETDENNDLVIN